MGCLIFGLLLVIQWTFLWSQHTEAASDPSCDYNIDLIFGQKYDIFNPNFPKNYSGKNSCIWTLKTATGTRIYLSCENFNLPPSQDCRLDRLSISLTGNRQLTDARNYCGKGTLSLLSQKSAMTVGLLTSLFTRGGQFSCTATAIIDTQMQTPPLQASRCDCGWRKMTRIVGGKETGVNAYAFMSALIFKGHFWCGASIISDRFILTAGHCVFGNSITDLFLIVGDHNLNTGTDTNSSALYKIDAFEIHPQYNVKTNINDIAILRTETIIIFDPKIGPICLPFRYTNYNFVGEKVTLLGWGTTEFTGSLAEALHEVNVNVISNQECSDSQKESITNRDLCTYAPGKDSCQYDSGGPVVWLDRSTNRYQLVGLISRGIGCGSATPGVNTRVTDYLGWIIQRTSVSYCIM